MSNILAARAMILTYSLTAWQARKADKQVTAETNAANNAAPTAGTYHKQIIAKTALSDINRIDGEIRAWVYAHTSPWLDREGSRIISGTVVADCLVFMRGKRFERESAIAALVAGFADYVAAARVDLNGMFKEADYPSPQAVAGKFSFSYFVDNVPDSDDIRVSLAGEQAEDIRREIIADMESRRNETMRVVHADIAARITKIVGRMAERLHAFNPDGESRTVVGKNGKARTMTAEGTFRDSLVDNVRELVDMLPVLNVTGDAAITAIADRMKALCVEDASALRDFPEVRADVAAQAESILADVSAYLA